jgi:hypothetical protein
MSASGFPWSDTRARLRAMIPARRVLHGLAALLLAACGQSSGSSKAGAPDAGITPDAQGQLTVCDYGTVYPGVSVIDPDNPVFENDTWTQQKVVDSFVKAKEMNLDSYRAYRAARDHSGYLECAFCKCGCENPPFDHESSIDCFKDMHGFA